MLHCTAPPDRKPLAGVGLLPAALTENIIPVIGVEAARTRELGIEIGRGGLSTLA
jgi:hypothetical protein